MGLLLCVTIEEALDLLEKALFFVRAAIDHTLFFVVPVWEHFIVLLICLE